MTRILHISCDVGDVIEPDKTPAISNLILHADRYEHAVISMNRTVNPLDCGDIHCDDDKYALRYFGLPAGVGLRMFLGIAASRLLRLVRERSLDVDVVHSHKLTFEGPVGQRIAAELGCPHVCTVRGDTDLKVLKFKPTYRRWYRSILADASAAFFVAPWTERSFLSLWPDALPARRTLLPNIVELPKPAAGGSERNERIVSVFHLKDFRRKNLRRLLQAVDECWDTWRPVYLDIIGGGDQKIVGRVGNMIRERRHPEAFRLLGHKSRSEIATALPNYAALVLPSRRETFGMVYLEALYSGIPFLQSENTGLDGYFDNDDVSVTVDPASVRAISTGIRHLLENVDRLKTNVSTLRQNGGLERFGRDRIVRSYTDTIADVLGTA